MVPQLQDGDDREVGAQNKGTMTLIVDPVLFDSPDWFSPVFRDKPGEAR